MSEVEEACVLGEQRLGGTVSPASSPVEQQQSSTWLSKNRGAIGAMLAGSIAGGCGIFVGHPFDSLKVRLQVGQVLEYKQLSWYVVRQLYRGVLPPLLTVGSISAMNFSLYEYFKRQIHHMTTSSGTEVPVDLSSKPPQVRLSTIFSAGVVSGMVSTAITCPLGIVKIQLQVASETGLWNTVANIYRTNGIATFYRGYSSALITEAPGRGVYLWTYEAVKARLHRFRHPETYVDGDHAYMVQGEVDLSTRVVAAACAGIFSWFVIYPADVIKARVQLDINKVKFRNTLHCLAETWKDGGFKGMYRGLSYTLIRAGPVAGTILPIYDIAKEYIEQNLA